MIIFVPYLTNDEEHQAKKNAQPVIIPAKPNVGELAPFIYSYDNKAKALNYEIDHYWQSLEDKAQQNDLTLQSVDSLKNSGEIRIPWALQLKSFSNYELAHELWLQLKDQQFRPFITQEKEDEVTLFWVWVGPEILRPRAVLAADKIKEIFKMEGKIMPYIYSPKTAVSPPVLLEH